MTDSQFHTMMMALACIAILNLVQIIVTTIQ